MYRLHPRKRSHAKRDRGQNVVPGILRWLELDDVVWPHAPRPLLTVSGRNDHIWPYAGAERV